MKLGYYFLSGVLFLSSASFARSLHPDTFRSDVAPVLKQLKVVDVADQGTVLKEERNHPYTKFLIAIPVQVAEASACTKFVGQQTLNGKDNAVTRIAFLGATDALLQACIEIYPEPVKTQLTLSFNVLTGGFVPANSLQKKFFHIEGVGPYVAELDMGNNTVAVKPLK
jgi:hypothetical protein